MRKSKYTLKEGLNNLLKTANGNSIKVETILDTLSGKGQAMLLIICALPFSQPLQIPGTAIPFGIILAFIGLRIAFGKRAWLPRTLLDKEVTYPTLEKTVTLALKANSKLQYFSKKRLPIFVETPNIYILHGIVIFILAIILTIPIPIPLTNLLAAIPIVFFGLGILEDDGLMIVIAYIFTLICLSAFFALIWFGKQGLTHILGILHQI